MTRTQYKAFCRNLARKIDRRASMYERIEHARALAAVRVAEAQHAGRIDRLHRAITAKGDCSRTPFVELFAVDIAFAVDELDYAA